MTGRFETIWAAAIVAVSLAISIVWLVRVPFFQSPDENAHADYTFALFHHGGIVGTFGRTPVTDLDPTVRYLEDATAFRTMRYNPDGRIPPGYGSRAYYRDVDAGAPRRVRDPLANGNEIPYVAQTYPYLYYVLAAVAVWAGGLLGGGAVVAEFFAARAFNVALLACSLLLTYLTLRELPLSRAQRLAILAVIGFFPLTSWVSAYVQPDNLAFTAVALAFYLSVRLRVMANLYLAALYLGLALGVLVLTKTQYFVPVAIASLAALLVRSLSPRVPGRRFFAVIRIVAIAPLVLGASSRLVSYGAATAVGKIVADNGNPLSHAAALGPLHAANYAASELARGLGATFFDGPSFASYWGAISWTDYRLSFGDPRLDALVSALLGAGSLLIALLVAVRLCTRVWPRLVVVARRRGALSAVRLLASDVLLNSYLLFAAAILAVFVATGGQLGTQGRYWLPLILPAILCAVRYAPRAFALRRLRMRLGWAALGVLLAYSVAGSVAGLAAIQERFYAPPASLVDDEIRARVEHLGPYAVTTLVPDGSERALPSRSLLEVDGYAVDSRSGLPALGVDVVIDGTWSTPATFGSAHPEVVGRLHDDLLLHSGFSATLDLRRLAAGPHELRLAVYERGRAAPYPSTTRVEFVVRAERDAAHT